MFKAKKIKKLVEKYNDAENQKEEQEIISELQPHGKPAVQHAIEAFQKRSLIPDKAQSLLESLCDDSCVEDIVPLISDHYHEVRRLAKEMILNRWRKAASPQLIEYLSSSDLYCRNNATELLTLFKDKSCVPELVSLFNNGNPDLKRNIIGILGGTEHPTAKKLIISAINDESAEVCLTAVKSLGKMKDPESVPILIEKLEDEDPQIRRFAMDALGAIGDKRAAGPMIVLLKDKDLLVRQKATEYLIVIADSEIVPDILNLMKSEDVNTRRCAIEVLNNLKDPRTSDALLDAIRDSDWWVRQIATDSLTEIKGDNIIKSFIAMLSDADESLRRCAVEFFCQVVHIAALKPLIGLLNDEDWWVREKAVTAIGKQQDASAITPLSRLVDDAEVKWSVPGALAEIGTVEVIDPLKTFLRDEQKRVRIEAIRAFSNLKWKDAIPDIRECLQDVEEDVRNEAAGAIERLTGKAAKAGEGSHIMEPSQSAVSKEGANEEEKLTEAIVVLDLCNAAALTSRYGKDFTLSLRKTLADTIVPLAKKEKCQLLKKTREGFLMTFPQVVNSVRFAFGTLQEVNGYNGKTDDAKRINLRFGINFGETRIKEQKDQLGMAVKTAFGVGSLKPDGLIPVENGMTKEEMPIINRILVTENVEKEIQNSNGVKTTLIGLFELKGVTGLHKVYTLTLDKESKNS